MPDLTARDLTARDLIVMVDWSAAASPVRGADSIWVAAGRTTTDLTVQNVATRAAAVDLLADLCSGDERVLIGLDVSLGAPVGLARSLGHDGAEHDRWRTVWHQVRDEVHDHDDNSNDRFAAAARLNRVIGAPAGPFWGVPRGQRLESLAATSPGWPVEAPAATFDEYRIVERRLLAEGLRPQSTWKLAYQASVGSQFLTAVGRLTELDDRVDGGVAVWPFEDHRDARVVVAEVWPGRHSWKPGPGPRDRDQVVGVAGELLAHRDDGSLESMLDERAALPADARNEEGWILGVAAEGWILGMAAEGTTPPNA